VINTVITSSLLRLPSLSLARVRRRGAHRVKDAYGHGLAESGIVRRRQIDLDDQRVAVAIDVGRDGVGWDVRCLERRSDALGDRSAQRLECSVGRGDAGGHEALARLDLSVDPRCPGIACVGALVHNGNVVPEDAPRRIGERRATTGIAASNKQRDIDGSIQRAAAITGYSPAAETVVVIAVMAAVHPMSGGFENGALDLTGADSVFQQQHVQYTVHLVMMRSPPRAIQGLMAEGCGT
jgi:hypothetical protein